MPDRLPPFRPVCSRQVSLDTPRASDTVAAAYNALRVAHCIIVEAIPAPPAFQARFFMALIDFLDRGLDLLSQPPSADSILADGPPVLVSQTLGVLGGQCLKLSELTVTQWTWVFTVLARAIRYKALNLPCYQPQKITMCLLPAPNHCLILGILDPYCNCNRGLAAHGLAPRVGAPGSHSVTSPLALTIPTHYIPSRRYDNDERTPENTPPSLMRVQIRV